MKRIVFSILFSICYFSVFAQVDSNSVKNNQAQKLNFLFETGTVFNSIRGYGNQSFLFFSPGININVNPKFDLKIRTIIDQPLFGNISNFSVTEGPSDNFQNKGISLYAEGDYQVTRKLHLTGTAFSNSGSLNLMDDNFSLYRDIYNRIEKAFSVGMYYQLSNNIQIGAEFRKIEYNRPLFFY